MLSLSSRDLPYWNHTEGPSAPPDWNLAWCNPHRQQRMSDWHLHLTPVAGCLICLQLQDTITTRSQSVFMCSKCLICQKPTLYCTTSLSVAVTAYRVQQDVGWTLVWSGYWANHDEVTEGSWWSNTWTWHAQDSATCLDQHTAQWAIVRVCILLCVIWLGLIMIRTVRSQWSSACQDEQR